MQDGGGEQQQHAPSDVLNSDPRFLIATTVAALLLAGSAFIWRSGTNTTNTAHAVTESRHLTTDISSGKRKDPDLHASSSPSSSRKQTSSGDIGGHGGDLVSPALVQEESISDLSPATTKDTIAGKSPRTKERRKRGKDPMKEILKGGKLKSLTFDKLSSLSPLSNNSFNPDDEPSQLKKAFDTSSGEAQAQRRHSTSTHSRTASEVSQSAQGRESPLQNTFDNNDPISSSNTSVVSDAAEELSYSIDSSAAKLPLPHRRSMLHPPPPPLQPESPTNTSTTSSYIDTFSSTNSASGRTTSNTSPTLSLSKVDDLSMTSDSKLSSSANPWDRDGVSTSKGESLKVAGNSEAAHKKTPRSQSKTKAKQDLGAVVTPFSYVSEAKPSAEDSHHDRGGDEDIEDADVISPLTFPSLNDPSPNSSMPSSLSRQVKPNSPAPSGSNSSLTRTSTPPVTSSSTSGSPSSSSVYGNTHSHTPRRAPTPRDRRPPTPSLSHGYSSGASTPPPSFSSPSSSPFSIVSSGQNSNNSNSAGNSTVVSVQTQMASMRGALEAARLREEKNKSDVERVNKELEMLRWENSGWRRREGELQAQVHHMMHQMQMYTTLFASMGQTPHLPPPPLPTSPQQSPNPAADGLIAANTNSPRAATTNTNATGTPSSGTSGDDNNPSPADAGNDGNGSAADNEADANAVTTDGNSSDANITPVAGNTVPSPLPANVTTATNANGHPLPPSLHLQMQMLHMFPQHQQVQDGNGGVLSPTIHSPIGGFPPYSHPHPFSLPPGLHGQPPQQPGGGNKPQLQQFPGIPFPFAFSPFTYPSHPSQPQSPVHPGLGTGAGSGPQPLVNPFSMFFPPSPHTSSTTSNSNPNLNPSSGSSSGLGLSSSTLASSSGNLGGMSNSYGHGSNVGILGQANGNAMIGNANSVVGHGYGYGRPFSSSSTGGAGSSSSIGSLSPDLDGSPRPTPVGVAVDYRGRGRVRPRTRTTTQAEVRGRKGVLEGGASTSSSTSEGEGDDGDEDEQHEGGDEDDDTEFNELLADAILKRPASIRVRSKKGSLKGKEEGEDGLGASRGSVSLNEIWSGIGGPWMESQPHQLEQSYQQENEEVEEEEVTREFTFPSLSELGNVSREKRMSSATYDYGERDDEVASLPTPPPSVSTATPPMIVMLREEAEAEGTPGKGHVWEALTPPTPGQAVVCGVDSTPEIVPA